MPALDDEVWMPELSHRHDVLAQCGVHRSRRHAPAGSEVTISEDLEPGTAANTHAQIETQPVANETTRRFAGEARMLDHTYCEAANERRQQTRRGRGET